MTHTHAVARRYYSVDLFVRITNVYPKPLPPEPSNRCLRTNFFELSGSGWLGRQTLLSWTQRTLQSAVLVSSVTFCRLGIQYGFVDVARSRECPWPRTANRSVNPSSNFRAAGSTPDGPPESTAGPRRVAAGQTLFWVRVQHRRAITRAGSTRTAASRRRGGSTGSKAQGAQSGEYWHLRPWRTFDSGTLADAKRRYGAVAAVICPRVGQRGPCRCWSCSDVFVNAVLSFRSSLLSHCTATLEDESAERLTQAKRVSSPSTAYIHLRAPSPQASPSCHWLRTALRRDPGRRCFRSSFTGPRSNRLLLRCLAPTTRTLPAPRTKPPRRNARGHSKRSP